MTDKKRTVHGRNRRNKAAFSNSSGLVWTGPKFTEMLLATLRNVVRFEQILFWFLLSDLKQFESTFFMRQTWHDSRLQVGKYYDKRNLTLNGDIMQQIWIPDTYVNNEKSSSAPKTEFLLKISPDGKVVYSQR